MTRQVDDLMDEASIPINKYKVGPKNQLQAELRSPPKNRVKFHPIYTHLFSAI